MQNSLLATLLIFLLCAGCSQNEADKTPESVPVENASEFDETDTSLLDAKLKFFLKLKDDKFQIVSVDVAHKYDAEKRAITPIYDSDTVSSASARVLEFFNSNIELFKQGGDPNDLHPCVQVHLKCAEIIAQIPQLPENGCECKCRKFPGTGWGIWFVCPEPVG